MLGCLTNDGVRRDAAHVGEAVAGEDTVRQHGVEICCDALSLQLILGGVRSVT